MFSEVCFDKIKVQMNSICDLFEVSEFNNIDAVVKVVFCINEVFMNESLPVDAYLIGNGIMARFTGDKDVDIRNSIGRHASVDEIVEYCCDMVICVIRETLTVRESMNILYTISTLDIFNTRELAHSGEVFGWVVPIDYMTKIVVELIKVIDSGFNEQKASIEQIYQYANELGIPFH